MRIKIGKAKHWIIVAGMSFVCLFLVMQLGISAQAASAQKSSLRVAFYPLDGFFEYDAQGNETGYGVELLEKISQYTGIKFTYVAAESWESTKQMLLEDEADVRMPGTVPVSKSTTLSYSASSVMDTYDVMMTLKTRDDLFYQDYDKMRTLKIAVSKSFYEVNEVKDYLSEIGVTEEQMIFCDEYNECYQKLLTGEADALVSNIMDMNDGMKMIARFNSISNYISMTLDNPYLHILDDAVAQIKLDEPMYLPNLYEKWFPERTIVPMTLEESRYLASLDTLTFAFQPEEGYLSHYKDGEYYGIYVEMAKNICDKLGVGFRAVSILDCQSGKASADVYAGFFYDHNFAEEWNYGLTTPVNDINYYLIKKKESVFDRATCRIAAIDKFRYTSDYLKKQYTHASFLYYDTYEECLKAVADGNADLTVINNYIAEYYLEMYRFSDLSAKLSTEYSHLFCFATENNNELLASILSKAIQGISDDEMNKIYIIGQEDKPEPNYLQAAMHQNPLEFTVVIAVILSLLVSIVLLLFFAGKKRKQNLILEKALCEKSRFLSRMSHDMRTPMNGILGLTYLMEKQESLENMREYIPELRESGKYLLQMINDVLDVNRIESGNLTLKPQICNEEKLFQSVINMMKPLMQEKAITFHFEKINIEWQYMILDEQRVKQIFINLLSNAVKFTPKGGCVDLIMECIAENENSVCDKFIVRDTGIGMSSDFLPHIFDAFRQEERINTDNSNGTGLGMTIVKQLVELMDGNIEVKSEENKGTEITLYLTFLLADNKTIVSKEQQTAENKSEENYAKIAGLHILLCEDHPLNAKIARKLLEQKGAEVVWAENGQQGVEIFQKSIPGYFDAILMDIRMPVMNGLEAAKMIRAMQREDAQKIPIIAMSANAYESDIRESQEAGINRHLAKPIEPQILFQTIIEQLL